jgi:DNA gyrase subunit A
MYNDLTKELGQNFIEYAVAVNSDRSIPDARSGLKPVARRIIYGAFDKGFNSSKPHVKCANIVGSVMADLHPHGDSSIYGALVRLSQPWVMRYPLIDFHGSNGNRDGDGPAAYRYTEARLAKLTENGLLNGIKKNSVDFMPNYSETMEEPTTLPSLFPNLLCNPNTGIGVAIACNWLPHNLKEVGAAINDYIDGKTPTLPGPDFPTGGIVINSNEIPQIMKTGKGTIKVRGKYKIEEDNTIVFYEIPYGIATEDLMKEIGDACDEERINGIKNIRNESNKHGFRLAIECEKTASIPTIINLLFKETSLQTSLSYNQVALIDKTPTDLNLEECIKIYVEHNIECLIRETQFDIDKVNAKLETTNGLLKALEDIDNIITLIKKSESSNAAKEALQKVYGFTEMQAKAIVDMKLGRLAGLERIELMEQKASLEKDLINLTAILSNPTAELKTRLNALISLYGDERKTELINLVENSEDEEVKYIEPEKCVVIMTKSGSIKRIPATSFKVQHRNTKGIKTQEDITSAIIRTDTVDSLMIFSDKGILYKIRVNDIPEGTNTSKGVSLKNLIGMEFDENPQVIYSLYKDNTAKYVNFVTKKGYIKRTPLEEYNKTKKTKGIIALNFQPDDSLVSVFLGTNEDILVATKGGNIIRFAASDTSTVGRVAIGVKAIGLKEGDEVISALPVRDTNDSLAIFSVNGMGRKLKLSEVPQQKRAGKGSNYITKDEAIAAIALVNDDDNVLICGEKNSICINASEIPYSSKKALGNIIIKGTPIVSVSKV